MARRKSRKKSTPKTQTTQTTETQASTTTTQATPMTSYNAPEATATATTEAPERSRTTVRPVDLAAGITKGLNEQHETLQTKANAIVIKEVFEQIRAQVESTEDGVISIPGLGTFNCRTVTREGEEGAEPVQVKRVNYRVAKAPQ